MKRWFIVIYMIALSVLWIIAWVGFIIDTPVWAILGLLLATSAPLIFLIEHIGFKRPRTEAHPMWVSGLCGLGAVMIMVTIYRFGEQHSIWMFGALASLGGWMVYLKLFPMQGEAES